MLSKNIIHKVDLQRGHGSHIIDKWKRGGRRKKIPKNNSRVEIHNRYFLLTAVRKTVTVFVGIGRISATIILSCIL